LLLKTKVVGNLRVRGSKLRAQFQRICGSARLERLIQFPEILQQ
jgi:hypothetical protein